MVMTMSSSAMRSSTSKSVEVSPPFMDFGSSLVPVFLLDLKELFFHDFENTRFAFQYGLELLDELDEGVQLFNDLVHFKAGKALEAHVEYRLCL